MSAFALLAQSLAWAAEPTGPFRRVKATELPQLNAEGDLESFKTAIRRQLESCLSQDLKATFRFGNRVVTRRKWCVETNREFLRLAERAKSFSELMSTARERFEWYQSVGRNGQGEVLFTGYYSPILESVLPGERADSREFSVPIYRQPEDLVQIVENGSKVWRKRNANGTYGPYWDREAIDQRGALSGRGLELAYTRDWFDAFLLQVEGAGVLLLKHPDGSTERRFINYAAQNGRPYQSIGKYLREQGVPEEQLTVPGMRAYFAAHPERLMSTLAQNPSYVFFRYDTDGPYGLNSVLLSPRHSVAVDRKIFPQGAMMLFQTERPEGVEGETPTWRAFTSLALTQDTGGAIQGPGRVDIYWGEDAYAEQAAGLMRQLGTLYLAILP